MISGTSCFHLFGANLLQLFSPLRKFRSQCRAQNFPLNSGGWEESLQALQQVDGFSKGLEFEMTLKFLFFLSLEKKQKTTGVVSTKAFVFFSTSGWELHGHVDMFRSVVVLFFRFDSWYPPWIRKPDSASAIDLQEVWQLDLIVLQILQKLQIRTTHPGFFFILTGFLLDNLTNLFGGLSQKKREEGCVPNDHGPFWPTVLRLFASCKLICWSWTWRSFHYLWNENFSNDFFFKS